MLVEEIPCIRLWDFLTDLRDSGEKSDLVLPDAMPPDADIKSLAYSILEKNKGSGYAGRLIGFCEFGELPVTVVDFLTAIYLLFPRPAPVPPIDVSPAGRD